MSRNRSFSLSVAALAMSLVLLMPWVVADTVDNPGDFTLVATSGYIQVGAQQFNINPDNPPTINGSIQTDGTVTIPTAGIMFPDVAIMVPIIGSITVRIEPQSDAVGVLNPITGQANFTISLRIRLIHSLLGSNCGIGPVTATITTDQSGALVGVPYDQTVGTAVYVNNEFGVPRSSGCGLFGGTIDSFAGLPSNPGNNAIVLSVQYDPILTGS